MHILNENALTHCTSVEKVNVLAPHSSVMYDI